MTGRTSDRPRPGPCRAARPRLRPVALGLAVLLAGLAGTPSVGATAAHVGLRPTESSTPMLTLTPLPTVGDAPLRAVVLAGVTGGTPPYSVMVCFGTSDHTSPPAHCNDSTSGWNGAGTVSFPHNYSAPGNFSVLGILMDADGNEVGSTALIVVEPAGTLLVAAESSEVAGAAPLTVRFNESVTGGTPPITIQWAFGDGSSGSAPPGASVAHTYRSAGTFTPVLTVSDGSGHQVIRDLPTITVSAAGTPPFGVSVGALDVVQWALIVAVIATAVGLTVGLRVLERRRLRREGNELVEVLEESQRAPPREPPGAT